MMPSVVCKVFSEASEKKIDSEGDYAVVDPLIV